jgi:ABC-type transporter Mla subunit MlaD
VSDGQTTWLAIIAIAVAVMAVAQIMLALTALRAAREMTATVAELRRDLKPVIDKAHRLVDEATRVTSLASLQVERVDRLLAGTAARIDETLSIVQSAVIRPVRQGAALLAGVRAALSALRSWQDRGRHSREDDEALFVG